MKRIHKKGVEFAWTQVIVLLILVVTAFVILTGQAQGFNKGFKQFFGIQESTENLYKGLEPFLEFRQLSGNQLQDLYNNEREIYESKIKAELRRLLDAEQCDLAQETLDKEKKERKTDSKSTHDYKKALENFETEIKECKQNKEFGDKLDRIQALRTAGQTEEAEKLLSELDQEFCKTPTPQCAQIIVDKAIQEDSKTIRKNKEGYIKQLQENIFAKFGTNDETLAMARLTQGILKQKLEDENGAEEDYKYIINTWPKQENFFNDALKRLDEYYITSSQRQKQFDLYQKLWNTEAKNIDILWNDKFETAQKETVSIGSLDQRLQLYAEKIHDLTKERHTHVSKMTLVMQGEIDKKGFPVTNWDAPFKHITPQQIQLSERDGEFIATITSVDTDLPPDTWNALASESITMDITVFDSLGQEICAGTSTKQRVHDPHRFIGCDYVELKILEWSITSNNLVFRIRYKNVPQIS